ncbi:MAG: YHS domain-containing (seleno)protein [Chthoniobacterales bacterium]
MKQLLIIALVALALPFAASAKDLVNVNWSGVAIKGYDPVAYFTDGKAVKGDSKFQSTDKGAIYYFASAAHKAAFDKEPAKYEPQFGGFCAFAVSKNSTAAITPEAFQIVDGRLLLQYDLSIREKFSADTAGNLKKADANWPGIVEKKGK